MIREELINAWTSLREKFATKIATLNTEVQKLKEKLTKQGYKLGTVSSELRVIKEFINPLFDPNNQSFILIKKKISDNQTLKVILGNYYQFSLIATWKIKDRNKLVITSIKNGQAIEHVLETLTRENPYYLGKLALTENEPVISN